MLPAPKGPRHMEKIDVVTKGFETPVGLCYLADHVDKELAARDARIAELEELVVWCANHDVKHRLNPRRFIDEDNGGRVVWHMAPGWEARFIACDGTPASILAACERAMKESQRG